ncbi:MAG: UbiD family decarboxylase [Chloroflexi bacterium]|nr:UbiD family decarboxylase [Chloroflexota bacterium]
MGYRDLREYMAVLEERGKLKRVTKEVDRDWEIASIARCVFQGVEESKRYALLFENIKGFEGSLATGVLGASREVYALALGTTTDKIYEKWADSAASQIPPIEVKTGPVKEVVLKGDDVDLLKIPVPVWTPGRDGGPFITSPCVISKDPDTGVQNVGTYRMMIKGRNQTCILIFAPQHIGFHYGKYEARNEPMPVAVAIGVDPSIGLTSVAKVPFGVDELAVAGGMRGEPVEVVRGETVDLLVPATAEYVIEGFVPPHVRVSEGPFGEYSGYMGTRDETPILNVTCITHRHRPIYQAYTSQMPPSESSCLRGQAFASGIWRQLVRELKEPGVIDVHITESSGSQAHVIVQMKPRYPGHAKRVALIVSGLDPLYGKIVTIVDPDIDIRDHFSVDWALSYRVDPARDVTIIPNVMALPLDPSTEDPSNVTTAKPFEERVQVKGSKMLIDATVKNAYPEISLAPAEHLNRAIAEWGELGLPPLELPNRFKLLLQHHPPGESFRPYQ